MASKDADTAYKFCIISQTAAHNHSLTRGSSRPKISYALTFRDYTLGGHERKIKREKILVSIISPTPKGNGKVGKTEKKG
uniref:Uncharacterized protein n=1 Tax=Pristionchus pacificus TaxID=54126 RepID=A0A2A6CRV5_PRIPA|eukprot:PDM80869.1 hypothetical protein PRIPAC_35872 [Pristionchus pacificus]